MKESNSKQSRKEPEFLIEMPHTLRHLIMKRGQMLRSGRTRTMFCLGKGGPKSWLQAKLIPNAGELSNESWDKAHELASKFKRELHSDVYVEPSSEYGRFKEMTSPQLPTDTDGADAFAMPEAGLGNSPAGVMSPFGLLSSNSGAGGFDPFGGLGDGASGSDHSSLGGPLGGGRGGIGGGVGRMNFPSLPHLHDPMKDILPPQVRQMMGIDKSRGRETSEKANRKELTFEPLKSLPGWLDLSESKQKMFEVEAALLQAGADFMNSVDMMIPSKAFALADPTDSERMLAALSVHPKISNALKRFLLENFEAMTPPSVS